MNLGKEQQVATIDGAKIANTTTNCEISRTKINKIKDLMHQVGATATKLHRFRNKPTI